MKSLPVVALIGQTNAGKSSILNRIARKNIAIVAREEGTTRDNVITKINNKYMLVDTAGLKDPSDDFEASIQDQISDATKMADVILVTLDSTKYFDFRDAKIAKDALRSKKTVFLVLNKADLKESLPIEEFRALGISPEKIFYVSATTGQGIKSLESAIENALPNYSHSLAPRDLLILQDLIQNIYNKTSHDMDTNELNFYYSDDRQRKIINELSKIRSNIIQHICKSIEDENKALGLIDESEEMG